MATIYERVDALEQTVENIVTQLTTLSDKTLMNNSTNIHDADLNAQIGKVIIAYGNNCTNKPTGFNGYLINIPHCVSPTTYNKQIWIERPANNVWVRTMENGIFGNWQPLLRDTGWIDVTTFLTSRIVDHDTSQNVQYRRINNHVYVRGTIEITNYLANTQVFTLPEGYRPGFSAWRINGATGSNVARVLVNKDGVLKVEYARNLTDGAVFTGDLTWVDISIDYFID